MSMIMTGPWRAVVSATERLGNKTFGKAVDDAVHHEAMIMLQYVSEGFQKQGLHRPWTKLSPVTLAIRRLSGFGGSKILQVSNSLHRSVTASRSKAVPNAWFVGVNRKARGRKGEKMINIAAVHEGPFPTLIPVTAKLRRFWMALFLQGAVSAPLSSKRKVLVIQARPFLRPAFEKTEEGSAQRMVSRISRYCRAHGIKM